MIRFVVAAVAIVVSVSTVVAQQDAIAARKALMKATGGQSAAAAKMIKGEEPFDLAKAKTVFTTFQDNAAKSPALYTPASKDGDTAALPKAFENKAAFDAGFAKFGADAKAAEAKVTDLDSFKAAFSVVAKNCGSCHGEYRAKK